MTEMIATYTPDWVSPPGETISDIAEERGWTQLELASRLGYSEKHISQLINGKVSLTIDTAQRLERVLGSTVDFWMKREANYQKHKSRIETELKYQSWTSWLEELPIKQLMEIGAIYKQRLDNKNKPQIVESCLRFYGVASPKEWYSHYASMEVDFRRTRPEQSDIGAISAWLRIGEKKAEEIDCPNKYNKSNFEKALKKIRNFTCENPKVFKPKMYQLLLDAGVVLVIVPSISRAHISGVARWLSPTRPLIQLSLYGKTNDKFWFTFFHEAAHILLHSKNADDKKSIFLDDSKNTKSNNLQEHEANLWASNFLIPLKYIEKLNLLRSKEAVKKFANEIGIHPGIVVGRLQYEQIIKPSWMNDLKESFKFV